MTLIKNRVIERNELDEEFESELRGYVDSVKTIGLPDLFLPPDKEVAKCIASATSAMKVAEDQRKVSLEPAVGDKRSAPDAPDAYDDNCQERGKGATAAVLPAGQKLADISSNAVAPPPPPPSLAPPPQPPPLPAEEERKRQEDEASKRQEDKASKRQEDEASKRREREASKRQGREAARPATSNAAAAGKDGVDAASALGRKMKKKGEDENGPGISHSRAGLRVSPILSLCPVAACVLFL
jgi:hypothetical protein